MLRTALHSGGWHAQKRVKLRSMRASDEIQSPQHLYWGTLKFWRNVGQKWAFVNISLPGLCEGGPLAGECGKLWAELLWILLSQWMSLNFHLTKVNTDSYSSKEDFSITIMYCSKNHWLSLFLLILAFTILGLVTFRVKWVHLLFRLLFSAAISCACAYTSSPSLWFPLSWLWFPYCLRPDLLRQSFLAANAMVIAPRTVKNRLWSAASILKEKEMKSFSAWRVDPDYEWLALGHWIAEETGVKETSPILLSILFIHWFTDLFQFSWLNRQPCNLSATSIFPPLATVSFQFLPRLSIVSISFCPR